MAKLKKCPDCHHDISKSADAKIKGTEVLNFDQYLKSKWSAPFNLGTCHQHL